MSENNRALVVDDSLVNRKLARAFLDKLGWSADVLENGQEVVSWLENNPPITFLLLDISMPGITGEEVCAQLREHPRFNQLPIIAYTAHAMKHDVDRFLANGFDTVLLKPNSVQDMKDAIDRVLAARGIANPT